MFHNEGMYFESTTTSTKKHFKVSFPYDVLLGLNWDADERKALEEYEKSDYISDKLLMLALIASKVESKPKLQKEIAEDESEDTEE